MPAEMEDFYFTWSNSFLFFFFWGGGGLERIRNVLDVFYLYKGQGEFLPRAVGICFSIV